MNGEHRKRRSLVPGADLLESRALLNADLRHAPIAPVKSFHAEAATKPIAGKLTTQVQFLPPNSSNLTVDDITISGSGTSTVGSAHLSGRAEGQNQPPTFVSRTVILTSAKIVNGTGTLSLGNGSTLALNFSGSYRIGTSKSLHTATYTLTGTATVQSGPNQGKVETFKATGTGPSSTLSATFHCTLK